MNAPIEIRHREAIAWRLVERSDGPVFRSGVRLWRSAEIGDQVIVPQQRLGSR